MSYCNSSPAAPLPPDKMRTFIRQQISYDQLVLDIATKTIRGSVAQLDRIINMIVQLQYETGKMIIGSFELPIEAVAHRLLQAKYYDLALVLRDMANNKISDYKSNQQLIQTLYNTIGSLRSYQYRQRKEYGGNKK